MWCRRHRRGGCNDEVSVGLLSGGGLRVENQNNSSSSSSSLETLACLVWRVWANLPSPRSSDVFWKDGQPSSGPPTALAALRPGSVQDKRVLLCCGVPQGSVLGPVRFHLCVAFTLMTPCCVFLFTLTSLTNHLPSTLGWFPSRNGFLWVSALSPGPENFVAAEEKHIGL